MAGRIGILQLALEQDPPRATGQRRENLTGTGNEAMQLEREEGAGPFATALGFRQADAGQKSLEANSACVLAEAAVLRQLFYSIVEGDRLLALQLLPVIKADHQLGPDSEGMAPKRLICEGFRQVAAKHCRKLRSYIFQLQAVICRALEGLVDDGIRADRRPEQARGDIGHCFRATSLRAFACHGGRCADADRRFGRCAAVPKTAHEDRHIGALAPAIGMQLVEHDELEPAGIVDDLGIKRVLPCQKQLGHHEVREQDIGWIVGNPLALLLALLARVAPHHRLQLFRQAGLGDELLDFLDLAVGQSVHRVDDDGARLARLPGFARTNDGIDNRDKEAQGFP